MCRSKTEPAKNQQHQERRRARPSGEASGAGDGNASGGGGSRSAGGGGAADADGGDAISATGGGDGNASGAREAASGGQAVVASGTTAGPRRTSGHSSSAAHAAAELGLGLADQRRT
nr:unnamed protein product [Digitaria exilis]